MTSPRARDAAERPRPRVLLFSERNTQVFKWEVALAEFQDVIAEVDAAELLAPSYRPSWSSPLGRARAQALNGARRAAGRVKEWPIDDVRIDGEYDLFFAAFHFAPNLAYLKKLKGLRERCRTLACFLIEQWTTQVPKEENYLRLLEHFDHVFLFNAAAVPAVERVVGRPCHFLPMATDAIRFCPYPDAPERVVDCYTVGRHSPATHRQLLDLAERREILYLYDVVNHLVPDYRAHRLMMANVMRRTKYFFAYRINEDRLRLTGGEEALAPRWFEGMAGGAVLLGSRPRNPEYDQCFDWPDSTIPLEWEPRDIGAVFAELGAQPDRLRRIRRDNVVNSLRRHDWVHRWARVLDTVGLEHTPAMRARLGRLETLAAQAAADSGDGVGAGATTATALSG